MVPTFALAAVMLIGVTVNPVPLTLTVNALVKLLPLTVMVLLTPLPVLVPIFTVEPLVGDVNVGVGVGVEPLFHALPCMLPQRYSASSG